MQTLGHILPRMLREKERGSFLRYRQYSEIYNLRVADPDPEFLCFRSRNEPDPDPALFDSDLQDANKK